MLLNYHTCFIKLLALGPFICFVNEICCINLWFMSHVYFFNEKTSAPIISCAIPGISLGIILSFACIGWNSQHIGQFSIPFSSSLVMLIHYMHSHANSLAFSMLMWFTSSWFRVLCCRYVGIIILLFFFAIPSMSSLNGQYGCNSFLTCSC